MRLPSRPFRRLPRWPAALVLLATALACLWSGFALETRTRLHTADIAERTRMGERPDMDLYTLINARVAAGENYYTVAAEQHRAAEYPLYPFVAVRTPALAWTTALWGAPGWRFVAALLWAANIIAWMAALQGRVSRAERYGAALLAGAFGMIAFFDKVFLSHEALTGLMLSLALALSAGRGWWAGLVLAGFAVALRELAMPFLFAWGAIALLLRDRVRLAAIAGVVMLLAIALGAHAAAVAAVRLPGDLHSAGWTGLIGPGLPLFGIDVTTVLVLLPHPLAGPLIVLALLGWLSFGGRLGAFAALWFTGFATAVALFARSDNFYWMGLFVPAYGIGLAFVPRALADLVAAVRGGGQPAPTPASPR